MKIILPAKDIPDQTEVTKVNGTKVYQLVKKGLPVYQADNSKVILGEGLCMLVPIECPASGISAIRDDVELMVWFDNQGDAIDFIEDAFITPK